MPRKPKPVAFGAVLAALCGRAGLTPPQLAEKAGLAASGVRHLIAGTRKPTWDTVQKLAGALGVPTDSFRHKPPSE